MLYIKNYDPKKMAEYYDLDNPKQRDFELEQKINTDVKEEHIDRLMYLFDNGYDLFNPNLALLQLAAREGRLRSLKFLLFMGAEFTTALDAKDRYNYTPLVSAFRHNQLEAAEFLIKASANPNICSDDDNLSPLHYAVMAEDPHLVELLIKAGASLNAVTTEDRNTPLHIAAQKGYKEIAKILLNAGASPTCVNKHKQFPLDLVERKQRHQWLDILPSRRTNSIEPDHFYLRTARMKSVEGGLFTQKRSVATLPSHVPTLSIPNPKSISKPPVSLMFRPQPAFPKTVNVAQVVTGFLRRMPK